MSARWPATGADLPEQGRRGRLSRQPEVTATYTLTDDNDLKLEFTATTDKADRGEPDAPFLFQSGRQGRATFSATSFISMPTRPRPVDAGLITTGEFADVTGTPFDFRTPTAIGARINDPDTSSAIRPRLRPQLGHQQAARASSA